MPTNRALDLMVLVCTRYDSVPGTPGPGGNANVIAALLECARVTAGLQTPTAASMMSPDVSGCHGISFGRYSQPFSRSSCNERRRISISGSTCLVIGQSAKYLVECLKSIQSQGCPPY